jgi:hypothetical protein
LESCSRACDELTGREFVRNSRFNFVSAFDDPGPPRTPGLREATVPYLHHGRFATIEKALDLSDREIADLASFLRSLGSD